MRLQNSPHQQPLDLPPGMFVGLAVAMALACFGNTHVGESLTPQADLGVDLPQVVRVSGQTVKLSRLGVCVTPAPGWTQLVATNRDPSDRAVFVNWKQQAVARLHPFRFQSWPPADRVLESTADGGGEAVGGNVSFDARELELSRYRHASVQWLMPPAGKSAGRDTAVGRLTGPGVDLLLHVTAFAGVDALDRSLADLCNAIEPLD